MQLNLDYSLCEGYKSNTQKMRVVTEKWVEQNMFCPICGRPHLHHYTANKPVADFCCESVAGGRLPFETSQHPMA